MKIKREIGFLSLHLHHLHPLPPEYHHPSYGDSVLMVLGYRAEPLLGNRATGLGLFREDKLGLFTINPDPSYVKYPPNILTGSLFTQKSFKGLI